LRHGPHIKVAAVASRWQRLGDLIDSGFEPYTSSTKSSELLRTYLNKESFFGQNRNLLTASLAMTSSTLSKINGIVYNHMQNLSFLPHPV